MSSGESLGAVQELCSHRQNTGEFVTVFLSQIQTTASTALL